MHKTVSATTLSVMSFGSGLGLVFLLTSPAMAQSSQCYQIRDISRQRVCLQAESDSRRYAQDAQMWRDEEARIRRDYDTACKRIGQIAKFVGQGRTFKAACVAPGLVNDRINR